MPAQKPAAAAESVTRTVQLCIDTKALSTTQAELFDRHAGTRRMVWNWALGLITDRKRLMDAHVHAAATAEAEDKDTTPEALKADKKWRTAAYKNAEAAHPTNFPYTAFGFDKEFTRLANEHAQNIRNGADPADNPFGWWVIEEHGVNRFTLGTALRDLQAALRRFYDGTSRGPSGGSRKPRKDGMPDGWPRFKSRNRSTPGFALFQLSRHHGPEQMLRGTAKKPFDGDRRVKFPNIGRVRIMNSLDRLRDHIANGGTPTGARFTKKAGRWYVSVTIRFDSTNPYVKPPALTPAQKAGGVVGVDLGHTVVAATSDGTLYPSKKPLAAQAAKRAKLSRKLARATKGSKRWHQIKSQIAKLDHKTAKTRDTFQHEVLNQIIGRAATVVFEDLQVADMMRTPEPIADPENPGHYLPNGRAVRRTLNRGNVDAAMGEMGYKAEYKCAWAGVEFVKVDPRNTSRTCPECGHIDAGNRHGAKFRCLACGYAAKATIVAAVNIRQRHLDSSPS